MRKPQSAKHHEVFRGLVAELNGGMLIHRERLTPEELAAMRHIMATTNRHDPAREAVHEIITQVSQTKNPDWF